MMEIETRLLEEWKANNELLKFYEDLKQKRFAHSSDLAPGQRLWSGELAPFFISDNNRRRSSAEGVWHSSQSHRHCLYPVK